MTLTRQGEILLILVKRDGRSAEEIAGAMGVDKSYLPKLYKMERLPRKPLQKAVAVFPDAESFFREESRKWTMVAEPDAEYRSSGPGGHSDTGRLMEENAGLRAEIARLNQELQQQKDINAKLAEAIVNMSKRP